ncbi:hypothetical protein [Limnochorda pilosa]|uniref:Uncharacterized protein n=1 Tax=Limnochorda pilosa TaxID=1555112 RepID=A0A0K2SNQ0_LIMPI|nr:hypothetical protein [Limnochorda pilosa]BAS28459.1 hypothetical protein LIP_2629 [Limnochorda pilosa]
MNPTPDAQAALGWARRTLRRRRRERFLAWVQLGLQDGGAASLAVAGFTVALLAVDLVAGLQAVPTRPSPTVVALVTVWVPWAVHLLPLAYALGAGLDFFPVRLHPFLLYHAIVRGAAGTLLRSAVRTESLKWAVGAALTLAAWAGAARVLRVGLPTESLLLATSGIPSFAAAPVWAAAVALTPASIRGLLRGLRPLALVILAVSLFMGVLSGDGGAAGAMPLVGLALLGGGWLSLRRALSGASPWTLLEGEATRAELGRSSSPSRRVALLRQWRRRGRNRLARRVATARLPRWCRGGCAYAWRAVLVWVGAHPMQPVFLAGAGILSIASLAWRPDLLDPAPRGSGFLGTASEIEGGWAYVGALLAALGLALARLPELSWLPEVERAEARRQLPSPASYLVWNGAVPLVIAGLGALVAARSIPQAMGSVLSPPFLALLPPWALAQAFLWTFCVLQEPLWSQIPPPVTLNPFQPVGSVHTARMMSLAISLIPGLATTLGTAWFHSVPTGLVVGMLSVPAGIRFVWRQVRDEWTEAGRAGASARRAGPRRPTGRL